MRDAAILAEQPPTDQEVTCLHLAELSSAMVRLYKDIYGRGPTKAKVRYAGHDLIVSTLEDSLTPAERKMAAAGEHTRLRELRMFLQYRLEADFVDAVERITNRRVRGFVSGIDTKRDIATDLFYLEPGR